MAKKQITKLSELVGRYDSARDEYAIISDYEHAKAFSPEDPEFAVIVSCGALYGIARLLDEQGEISGICARTKIQDEIFQIATATLENSQNEVTV